MLGCHGNPDRCLVVAGRRTPLCARCLGFVAGNLIALVSFLVVGLPTPAWTLVGAAAIAPAFVDASVQAATGYRSTSARRVTSGVLAGYGQIVLLGGFFGWAAPRLASLLLGG
ncbi:MAG: DUF2085 domain-containing protein [Gemmatimonadota bacterium]|nr:DUF2085 domain-containing protein [Gemmatimonadota bacterium]